MSWKKGLLHSCTQYSQFSLLYWAPFKDGKNKKTDLWFKRPIEALLIVSQYYCCLVEAKEQQNSTVQTKQKALGTLN